MDAGGAKTNVKLGSRLYGGVGRVAERAPLLVMLRIARWELGEPRPSRIDTLAAEQLCLDCKDILGSPTLAKYVPDGRR
jgi:hypothetical protein